MKNHKVTDEDLAQQLLALEKQYWTAIMERDVDTAMKLSDDTCIVTGAQGVGTLDKKDLPAMMKRAPYDLRDFRIDDVTCRRIGDDVAILAYKVHEELEVDGKPIVIDAADASTWFRSGDSWKCALHTESLLGDPFGRDRRPKA